MVTKLKEVDVVVIGQGLTGVMMAKEMTMAGLTVVGLERGPDRRPEQENVLPRIRDELRYNSRKELMIDNAVDTATAWRGMARPGDSTGERGLTPQCVSLAHLAEGSGLERQKLSTKKEHRRRRDSKTVGAAIGTECMLGVRRRSRGGEEDREDGQGIGQAPAGNGASHRPVARG